MGRCCQDLKNYDNALKYYVKVLQIAWITNNKKQEILAYDLVGVIYFYKGDIDTANYYHTKMTQGSYFINYIFKISIYIYY